MWFIFQTVHLNDIKINCTQAVKRKHFPMFSFHHLKRMAAINQLNNFLNKKQLLQYRVCMAIKYYCFYSLWQNKKPQKQRNMFKVKCQCIWNIYFLYLSNCDSNPEFPFSLHKKPAWWSQLDQTHRLLLHQAGTTSDEFSYWPAETCPQL